MPKDISPFLHTPRRVTDILAGVFLHRAAGDDPLKHALQRPQMSESGSFFGYCVTVIRNFAASEGTLAHPAPDASSLCRRTAHRDVRPDIGRRPLRPGPAWDASPRGPRFFGASPPA